MSMIKQTQSLIPITPSKMSDEEFSQLSSSVKFLPRVQLFTDNSKLCKQKKFPTGHYGLMVSKDKAIDMDEQFDCLPINVRGKALDMRVKPPVSVFDPQSEQFQVIKAASAVKNSSCMFGAEYLIWLPKLKRFATFYFGTPTMRRSSAEFKELIGYATTCSIEWIPSEEYGGWHGPVITECTTPLESIPSDSVRVEQEQLFLNPGDMETEDDEEEVVTEGTPARAR